MIEVYSAHCWDCGQKEMAKIAKKGGIYTWEEQSPPPPSPFICPFCGKELTGNIFMFTKIDLTKQTKQ